MTSISLPLPRLCQDDNWHRVEGDGAPWAVRWSTGYSAATFSERWTKWHYTEGNGGFTACGRAVVIGAGPTMFPEQGDLEKIGCRQCRAKMQKDPQP